MSTILEGQTYTYCRTNYIGFTTRGARTPVFFDPNTALLNDQPPGTLVTGVPGVGKTFFLSTLVAISGLMGKMTIVLDRKGDFLSMRKLENELGEVDVWDVSAATSAGLLDPFFLGENPEEKMRLTTQFIEILVPTVGTETMAQVAAYIQDVLKFDSNPSMGVLTNKLVGSDDEGPRDVGLALRKIVTSNQDAGICFARPGTKARQVKLRTGTTIVNLSGLATLPDTIEKARATESGRLATGIMFLITDFIYRMMKKTPKELPKMLLIDEAWSILATEQGTSMVRSALLEGRSFNFSCVLATQVFKHIAHMKLDDTVSTYFMFRNSRESVLDTLKSIGRDPYGDNNRLVDVVTSLRRGECLMRDWTGQYAPVHIHGWREEWNEAFETNPERARALEEKRRQEESNKELVAV